MLKNVDKMMGTFTMILSDPNCKLGGIIRKPAYMFGGVTNSSFRHMLYPFQTVRSMSCTLTHDR
jgi:hypothetical protein